MFAGGVANSPKIPFDTPFLSILLTTSAPRPQPRIPRATPHGLQRTVDCPDHGASCACGGAVYFPSDPTHCSRTVLPTEMVEHFIYGHRLPAAEPAILFQYTNHHRFAMYELGINSSRISLKRVRMRRRPPYNLIAFFMAASVGSLLLFLCIPLLELLPPAIQFVSEDEKFVTATSLLYVFGYSVVLCTSLAHRYRVDMWDSAMWAMADLADLAEVPMLVDRAMSSYHKTLLRSFIDHARLSQGIYMMVLEGNCAPGCIQHRLATRLEDYTGPDPYNTECPYCLEPVKSDAAPVCGAVVLPCRHVQHVQCMALDAVHSKTPRCAICRQTFDHRLVVIASIARNFDANVCAFLRGSLDVLQRQHDEITRIDAELAADGKSKSAPFTDRLSTIESRVTMLMGMFFAGCVCYSNTVYAFNSAAVRGAERMDPSIRESAFMHHSIINEIVEGSIFFEILWNHSAFGMIFETISPGITKRARSLWRSACLGIPITAQKLEGVVGDAMDQEDLERLVRCVSGCE